MLHKVSPKSLKHRDAGLSLDRFNSSVIVFLQPAPQKLQVAFPASRLPAGLQFPSKESGPPSTSMPSGPTSLLRRAKVDFRAWIGLKFHDTLIVPSGRDVAVTFNEIGLEKTEDPPPVP